MTHAETVWLIQAFPVSLTLIAVLLTSVLLRGRLLFMIAAWQEGRSSARRLATLDPALWYSPAIVTPSQLLGVNLIAALIVIVVLSTIAPFFVALLLAAPTMVLITTLLLAIKESKYRAQLDSNLVSALGRLSAMLRGSMSVQGALQKVANDLPEQSALRMEWSFLLERLGAPMADGKIAGLPQVIGALLEQTVSERHRTFLGHLESVIGQDQSLISARVAAAYSALQSGEQRRSKAATALAQVRYGGMAIGGSGLFISVYLFFQTQERFIAAYSGPLGIIVGPIMVLALSAPIVGGLLLSQADDIDY